MGKSQKKHAPRDWSVAPGIKAEPVKPTRDAYRIPEDQEEIPIEIVLESIDEEDIDTEVDQYTDDSDVIDDFTDRQEMNAGGENLLGELETYNQRSAIDSVGGEDADWEDSIGDETFTGDLPTPDQDAVDDLGSAAGLSYGLEEPLDGNKINQRDVNRWELDPHSVDDEFDNERENPADES